jgi:hypothetical protein
MDVGAENTAVAVLREGWNDAELLSCEPVALTLTQPGAELPLYLGTYFFPQRIDGEPFATAVVHQAESRAHMRGVEPVPLDLNILFSERVTTNDRNRIATDVKPGARDAVPFLAVGFARAAALLVLACLRERGIAPPNVTLAFGFANSADPVSRAELRSRWQSALASGDTRAPTAERPGARLAGDGIPEGRAALRFFAQRNLISRLDAPFVILDVGATGTGLTACAGGRIVALDSLFLAGRHLTGAPAGAPPGRQFGNGFVRAFAEFAVRKGLPLSQTDALRVFAERGDDALAFRHLVRTRWFEESGAALFRSTDEHARFRVVLFYFFGALFHVAGLVSRAARAEGEEPLGKIVLAGNGSRYLTWLARSWEDSAWNPMREALLGVFAAAAGEPAGPIPRVVVSAEPKEEVARGLALSDELPGAEPPRPDAGGETVLGERLVAAEEAGGTAEPTARRPSRLVQDPVQIRWAEGTMEIERFHHALEVAASAVPPDDPEWRGAVARLREVLDTLGRGWIQGATHLRLDQLRRSHEAVPGNLFAVEAAVVVERLIEVLFER